MALQKWILGKALSDPAILDRFESKYGIPIPSDLKACILSNNGAYPVPAEIKLTSGFKNNVKALLSYEQDDPENIYEVMPFFKKEYGKKLLPFATNESSDYYCIQKGKVVLWTQSGDIFDVSNDFTSFINALN
ncbi:SMI1/KNR4 family protein [Mailhella massiliensis]|uniref:SMI1/KNR4 family protein n=1 Tax=Mailhella massiliensis TaxID=1903261 RepID=UPI00235614DF|nr:SMI1/KNR4 family protein [Mailhella massiliensis]